MSDAILLVAARRPLPMKIPDIFNAGRRSLSFEFFPPKTPEAAESLSNAVKALAPYKPDYASMTYGAGGSTRDMTVETACQIKRDTGIEVMAHVTCVSQTKDEVKSVLDSLEANDIENVLGLRGDPPGGETTFTPTENGFHQAADLISYIRENYSFGVGGACFPEGHPDSTDLDTDVAFLAKKVDVGAQFLVTQLFFDNEDFFRFMDRCQRAGIDAPVVAGVIPVLSTPQIRRFVSFCGAKIPAKLDEDLERFKDDDASARQLGIEYAVGQIEELWEHGVSGVHIYTLNRSYSTRRILDALDLDRS